MHQWKGFVTYNCACVYRGLTKNTWPQSIRMSGKWEKQGCILSLFKGSKTASQPPYSNTPLWFLEVSSPYLKSSVLKHKQNCSAFSPHCKNLVGNHESKPFLHSMKLVVQITYRDGRIVTSLIHCQSKEKLETKTNACIVFNRTFSSSTELKFDF